MKRIVKIFLTVIALGLAPGAFAQNITLPRPPAELRTVPSRAGWLVEHYWDLTDFEHVAAGDASEQAFVNYLSLFPLTESDSLCSAAVGSFVQKMDSLGGTTAGLASGTSGSTAVICMVIDLAEKYLYDLDSPLASEQQYLWFIDAGLRATTLPPLRKEILLSQKRVIQNNPVGSQIADFYFETQTGAGVYFHQLLAAAELPAQTEVSSSVEAGSFEGLDQEILLLFFEIGCSNCEAMIEKLKAECNGKKVVAIALNTTVTRFRAYAATLPESWTVGFDSTGAINGTIFAIRHLPDLYRLAPDGTILGKHINLP